MPRSRRGTRDEASEPPDDPWHGFYLNVKTFRVLAPWRWMSEEDTFGVVDSQSGEIGWCCIIGAAGLIQGVVLYRGDGGHDFLQRMLRGEIPEDEGGFGQDAISLVFVDSTELSSQEKRRIRSHQVSFRGRGNWPKIESHGLDRLPRQPSDDEVVRMHEALHQAALVAVRARQEPAVILPDRDGRLLVRVPSSDARDDEWIDARRMPSSPRACPIPQFDRGRAEHLRRSLPGTTSVWECDVFPGLTVIAGPGKDPYCPAMFMLADVESGFILKLELGEPKGRDAWAQNQLLDSFETAGVLPARLRFKRPALARLLGSIAESLGIRVEQVKALPAIDQARPGLDRVLSRGGGRLRT